MQTGIDAEAIKEYAIERRSVKLAVFFATGKPWISKYNHSKQIWSF